MPATPLFAGLPTNLCLLSNHSDIREARVSTNIAHVVMTRYSARSLRRGAGSCHQHWARAWREPSPESELRHRHPVGSAGRGLATAYYSVKNHHIANVAGVERGRHYHPFTRGGAYVSQSSKGEMVMGAGLDSLSSYAQPTIASVMPPTTAGFPQSPLRNEAAIVDVMQDPNPAIGATKDEKTPLAVFAFLRLPVALVIFIKAGYSPTFVPETTRDMCKYLNLLSGYEKPRPQWRRQ
jgi:hypothetical protein